MVEVDLYVDYRIGVLPLYKIKDLKHILNTNVSYLLILVSPARGFQISDLSLLHVLADSRVTLKSTFSPS